MDGPEPGIFGSGPIGYPVYKDQFAILLVASVLWWPHAEIYIFILGTIVFDFWVTWLNWQCNSHTLIFS